MKAVVYSGYGSPDVLKCVDVEKPIAGDDQVVVKVRAASANAPDWRIVTGKPFAIRLMFGLRKPRIRPGVDLAGEVEAVGRNVTQFKPGDAVFGVGRGAFAEYVCTSESRLVVKPDNVTFEQAACVPVAGFTALQALRDKGKIQPGQSVLVNGAAGGVGTFTVQIAKALGAQVTGVCSTANVEMVRSIGADHVIDYTREDFTASGQRYDLILDIVGNHSISAIRRALNPTGVCVMVGAPKSISTFGLLAFLARPLILSRFTRQKFVAFMAKSRKEDLTTLCGLVASGKVTPVIDRRYSLSEVSEAIRYLSAGHARGKVVITPE
jgi:NADPH:quinone reductase-like Zn-dependent oxidoreductase